MESDEKMNQARHAKKGFRKGFIWGIVVGAVACVYAGIGMFVCHWNFAESSVVPHGACRSGLIILAFPVMVPVYVVAFLIGQVLPINDYVWWRPIMIVSLIVVALLIGAIGGVLGWLANASSSRD